MRAALCFFESVAGTPAAPFLPLPATPKMVPEVVVVVAAVVAG
jgi:hypothetical protein